MVANITLVAQKLVLEVFCVSVDLLGAQKVSHIIKPLVGLSDFRLGSCFILVGVESLTFGFWDVMLKRLVINCDECVVVFSTHNIGHHHELTLLSDN